MVCFVSFRFVLSFVPFFRSVDVFPPFLSDDTIRFRTSKGMTGFMRDYEELISFFLSSVTDFGESHYIGPLHDDNTDLYAGGPTGAVKWVKG